MKRRLFEDDSEPERIQELEYLTATHKRPRLVWTSDLHNRFLEAINAIGYHRAFPKKILQYMNVPGLTRENVASHLQKYRVYLKRLCKANSSTRTGMLRSCNDSILRSTFFSPPYPNVSANNSLPYLSNTMNLGQQAGGALPSVFSQSSLGGQQAETLPSMHAYGASTSRMPLTGTSFGAFQGPSMINTLPNNNVLRPTNLLGSAGASHADQLGHFTGHTQAQESFMPIVQNNSHPIDGGDLTDAAMQFFSCPQPTSNLTGENQGQTLLPRMTEMGGVTANYGGEPSDPYGGLLNNLANDMTSGNMTLREQRNPNVNSTILTDDGLENFLSSLEKEALNNNPTPENPFVEQAVTMARVDNYIPTDHAAPVVENIANDVPLIQNDAEQDMSNFGTSSGSPVVFQNWAIDNQDEFCLDKIDDLVAFLSNFEGNIGGNNQLP
ncbi:hypothetical protein Cgig2_003755 [Carnegiea gigantea]|uniref:HTH myb-type domain-containing protein n=1 Tax=Carnegiea gigantea TaxID=171969 RepID=A0A9Q1K7V1_9CARY|nr:hypothetical protein Cgig2_003755 [Carnegiea gigantea]